MVHWNQVNSRNFTTKSNPIEPNLPNLISLNNKKNILFALQTAMQYSQPYYHILVYKQKTSMFTRGCCTQHITKNCIKAGVYICHVQIYLHMVIVLKMKKK